MGTLFRFFGSFALTSFNSLTLSDPRFDPFSNFVLNPRNRARTKFDWSGKLA